jgi:ABC-type uncharacterized transport system substrate-binding protein
MIVLSSAKATVHRDLIIGLAARHQLPRSISIASSPAVVASSPMARITIDPYRRAAGYVDRILRGAKPTDLPVQAPTKFEMVINLRTAKALRLSAPDKLLALADEVIK